MNTNLLQRAFQFVLIGVSATALLSCGGGGGSGTTSGGGGVGATLAAGEVTAGTAVRGTFVDEPVQGLIYKTNPSGDWTARESDRSWKGVASSTDGSKLVAVSNGGQIFTSADSGVTWTARESNRDWNGVASSADGSKLVALVSNGQIYTSTDSGVTWTARDSRRNWNDIASSADGSKLVAVVSYGQIYTSTDSGVTWTARESNRNWKGVASSADGSKLVTVQYGGPIFTSADSGVTWTARESNRNWYGVASSADGSKLVATAISGQIYTSVDSGVTWTARDSNRNWRSVASSADGSKLVALVDGGQIYTSADSGLTWTSSETYRRWYSTASSADGSKLVAATLAGQIYTYSQPASATTGVSGTYACTAGADTTFYLGNYLLGSVKCGQAVHVYQMAGTGSSISKGLRIAQLLQSLDLKTVANQITLPDMSGITIDPTLLEPNDSDAQFSAKANAILLAVGRATSKTFALVTPAAAQAHVTTELGKLTDTQKAALCVTNTCKSDLLTLLVNPAGVSGSLSGLPAGKSYKLSLFLQSTGYQYLTLSEDGKFGFPTVDLINDVNQSYFVFGTSSDQSVSCGFSENSSGTLRAVGVSTVAVTCTAATPQNSVLSGKVTGLAAGQSVQIQQGTGTLSVSANGNFKLPTAVTGGSNYVVTTVNPSPANLACTVANGSDNAPLVYGAGTNSISNITVSCVTPAVLTYTLGGTVSGLSTTGSVTLVVPSGVGNGTTTLSVLPSGALTATYTTPAFASGTVYNVRVLSTSAGLTCVSQAGVMPIGTVGSANVTGIDWSCSSSGGGGGGGGPVLTVGQVGGTITLNGTVTNVKITNAINVPTGTPNIVVVNAGGTFTMTTALNPGDTYNISAGPNNPADTFVCTFTNFSGTMPSAGATPNYVNNVAITCN